MDFISVPIIVLCCYIIGEVYKCIFKKNTKKYKLIPVIVAFLGGVLGVVIFYTAPPTFLNVSNMWDAMTIGIISGFTSTGANQVVKQLLVKGNE